MSENKYFDLPFWQFYNPDFFGHDIYVEEFGYGVCTPGWIFSETRKNHLLQFVFDGISHVTVGDDKTFVVDKGSAFYLPPNVPHSYLSDIAKPTTRAWISWSGEMASQITQNFQTFSSPYHIQVLNLNDILKQFQKLYNMRVQSTVSSTMIYSCFYRILSNCMSPTIPTSRAQVKNELLFEDIIHYVDNNIMSTISVADISHLFGYDASSIYRKFKQHTGMSLKEYIQHRRIALAMGLICETDLSLNEIAIRCGYNDKAALNMLFLRQKNISLAQYVAEHRT